MGIYDREYYRDDEGGLFAWGRRGVTVWIIAITCAVWLAQIVSRDAAGGGPGAITAFGIYNPVDILHGQVWRLLTPIFLHVPVPAGLLPLAFYMLTLYWFGSHLEERYGGREFLLFYLTSGVVAHTLYFLCQLTGLLPAAVALGSRGPVLATLVLFACYHPRQQILFFFVLPMPVWLLVVVYVVLDLFGSAREGFPLAIYLGSAAFAFLYYWFGWRLSGLIPSRPKWGQSVRRPVPRLRVLPPDPEDEPVRAAVEAPPQTASADEERFEVRVDRVLDKVARHGQESLTNEERELLFRASEIFKRRRK